MDPYRPTKPIDAPLHPLVKDLSGAIRLSGVPAKTVSRLSGYSHGYLSSVRRGRINPSLAAFVDIANVLGYDVRLVKRLPKGD